MFGQVTPLGWPRSVYKSDIECCFLKFWIKTAKWPWKSRSITPIFNTSCGNSKMHAWCKFGDCSSNPLQVITWTNRIYKSKWPKWPWRSRSITPFSIPAKNIPERACFVQIWWLYLKSITSYLAEKPNFLEFCVKLAKKNYLEGKAQWPPFSMPAESIPGCIFGANLVIPGQICNELSCRQRKVYWQMDVFREFDLSCDEASCTT